MELLPCPFCGSERVSLSESGLWVMCDNCEGDGPTSASGFCKTPREGWNSRTPADPALLASVAEWRALAETQDAIIQRGATLTDPALLALAKFGALVVGDHLSPTGGFTHARYEALDRAGLVAGVIVPGGETGPVAAPGIADAIAALLAPDGAASEGVTDGD